MMQFPPAIPRTAPTFLLWTGLFLCSPALKAQSPIDTTRWASLHRKCNAIIRTNPDSAFFYATQALAIAKKTHYSTGIARSYLSLGTIAAYIRQQPASALAHCDSASLYPDAFLKRGNTIVLLQTKAQAYSLLGQNGRAAKELLQVLALAEQPPVDSAAQIKVLNNIGILVMNQMDYRGSLTYYTRGLALARRLEDKIEEGTILGNMAASLSHCEGLDSALSVLAAAAALNKELGNRSGLISNELNMGSMLVEKHELGRARAHYEAALSLLTPAKNYYRIVNCLASIAHTYQEDQPLKGLQYVHRAEALLDSVERESWEWKRNLYRTAALLCDKTRDYKQAYAYALRSNNASDSLNGLLQGEEIAIHRENYEVNKRDARITALAAQQAISDTQRNWGIAVVVLLLGFAAFAIVDARRRQKLNTDLQAANAVKDRIMSILSHDLRAPLNTLNSFLQLTSAFDMPPGQRALAERQLGSQLKSTIVMLDNLLRWSLTQVKGRTVTPIALSAHEVVAHAIEPLLGLMELKSLRLSTDLADSISLLADRDTVVFIVRNLVSNAIKFAPAGSALAITASTAGGQALIRVRDHGPGMDAEKIKSLFSMQQNTSTTGSANEKGTGIGLPLAAEMALKNGGSLSVHSEPGHGSEFVLALPLAS